MLKTVELSPHALADVETARDYLKVTHGEHDEAIRTFLNAATGVMEAFTARQLKTRTASLRADGSGDATITSPEWPITAISSIKYYSGDFTDATLTTMNATGRHWTEFGGVITNPMERFPRGRRNIQINGTFGYDPDRTEHKEAYAVLEFACLRLVIVQYQDWANQVGREQRVEVGGVPVMLSIENMPKDVKGMLQPFARIY